MASDELSGRCYHSRRKLQNWEGLDRGVWILCLGLARGAGAAGSHITAKAVEQAEARLSFRDAIKSTLAMASS
jgi:hypothetical protein